MMIVRPIRNDDLASLMALAEKTGVGVTSLPRNEQRLAARIDRAVRTMNGEAPLAEQCYLFVLEDADAKQVVGICAVEVAVGLAEAWYNYRVGTLVHASKELDVYTQMPTLFLSNDHTGYSELCSLFLSPDYRKNKNGALLSKSRFLFMAAFQEKFAKKVIAEMRGVSDEKGLSPFWESLGRHFFSIEFSHADYLTGIGQKAFVAELMPKHPLYVTFLSDEAQSVIGKVHEQTAPARAMLESEGFRYEGYVDIFDAGPTIEAYTEDVRAIKQSRVYTVAIVPDDAIPEDGLIHLVSNDQYQDFRVLLAKCSHTEDVFPLTEAAAQALGVKAGDGIRAVTLNPMENH
ncbi:arginine N-succinyltransferase [Leeia sp. TBRC 13508]|uniref:Arginine N-succinyltransferase n=1 Tax=Leeia speluncae TaxID=2884804 RepID=A0ABS8D9D7_9NEIS|nr:arginine N-succinyltransferase [Leeia speluncae]MCB6184824.1 arginine N-succinyltransferase [Leeia speluncae]